MTHLLCWHFCQYHLPCSAVTTDSLPGVKTVTSCVITTLLGYRQDWGTRRRFNALFKTESTGWWQWRHPSVFSLFPPLSFPPRRPTHQTNPPATPEYSWVTASRIQQQRDFALFCRTTTWSVKTWILHDSSRARHTAPWKSLMERPSSWKAPRIKEGE